MVDFGVREVELSLSNTSRKSVIRTLDTGVTCSSLPVRNT